MFWNDAPSDNSGYGDVHYNDVRMSAMVSQITSLEMVYSTVYSDTDQRKHQGSASLAFVRGIHRWPVNYMHKGPVTPKMFPFDDVIMYHHCADHDYLHPYVLHRWCFPNDWLRSYDTDIVQWHAIIHSAIELLAYQCAPAHLAQQWVMGQGRATLIAYNDKIYQYFGKTEI